MIGNAGPTKTARQRAPCCSRSARGISSTLPSSPLLRFVLRWPIRCRLCCAPVLSWTIDHSHLCTTLPVCRVRHVRIRVYVRVSASSSAIRTFLPVIRSNCCLSFHFSIAPLLIRSSCAFTLPPSQHTMLPAVAPAQYTVCPRSRPPSIHNPSIPSPIVLIIPCLLSAPHPMCLPSTISLVALSHLHLLVYHLPPTSCHRRASAVAPPRARPQTTSVRARACPRVRPGKHHTRSRPRRTLGIWLVWLARPRPVFTRYRLSRPRLVLPSLPVLPPFFPFPVPPASRSSPSPCPFCRLPPVSAFYLSLVSVRLWNRETEYPCSSSFPLFFTPVLLRFYPLFRPPQHAHFTATLLDVHFFQLSVPVSALRSLRHLLLLLLLLLIETHTHHPDI